MILRHFIRLFSFILFLIPLISFGQQKEVYLDEALKKVDSINFYKKCDARSFYCLEYKTDSLIINKVHNRFKFGKVSKNEYNQIRLLLIKRGNTEIANDQILVIEHIDTIGGSYSNYIKNFDQLKNTKKNQKTSSNTIKGKQKKVEALSEKEYNRSYIKRMKRPKKCVRIFEKKYNTRVFITYKAGEEKKHLFKGINWVEYPGIIIPKFLNQIRFGHYLILKPDGEYFVSSLLLRDIKLEELFKNPNWSKHKNDLELSKSKNSNRGYGIFRNSVVFNQNLNLCF